MNRCPITYELCETRYSQKGLKLLSKDLTHLHDFAFTAQEQIELASQFEFKISIQGIQPKLSTRLNVKKGIFEIVETKGKYIFKPPHHLFKEVPENEDLSMRLAAQVGIEVPLHGMIYNKDNSLSYFVKRFDRLKNRKVPVEDFSQLLGYSRDTKYESSMEQIVSVINKYCTFPMTEKNKLFKWVIFNFLIGNEDMHLKNFSLIRHGHTVTLSPAYDLLNTTLIMNAKEEIALPLRGRKNNLKQDDFFDYFGKERLNLPEVVLKQEIEVFANVIPVWTQLIENSFLSLEKQKSYQLLISERWKRIQKR